MVDPVVILTYPGHYLLTALTIKSYLKYHRPTNFIVVADDLSLHAWDNYVHDCKKLYQSLIPTDCQIQPSSNIIPASQFKSGWVRQQIIKLHLDQVVDFDSWFFTDGDIVFLHSVESTDIPYTTPDSCVNTSQDQYVTKVLGIANPGIRVNNQRVAVDDPAFRTMTRLVLQGIRQHVQLHHQKSLSELHLEYEAKNSIEISEWQLIENYKQRILGQELKLVKYAPHNLLSVPERLDFFSHQFLTYYGTDANLGRDFFNNYNVTVSDQLWQILSNIQR